jgi:hypothetical protein
MGSQNLQTMCAEFMTFFAAQSGGNYTNGSAPASYPATVAPTSTRPQSYQNGSGTDGIIDCNNSGNNPGSYGKFIFFATYAGGVSAHTFNAKIVGWQKAENIWIPITLAEVLCTTGTAVGVGTVGPIKAVHYFAGTVVKSSSNILIARSEIMPADNGIQMLILDLTGVQALQLLIGTPDSGSGAAAANGMVAWF